TMPPRVLEMKSELLEKIEKIRNFGSGNIVNRVFPGKKEGEAIAQTGIITSGVSYLYVAEALDELGVSISVLKVDLFYPLAEEKVRKFIKGLKTVLVVEELEPYLEREIERLAKEENCKLKIFGKNLLPEIGEIKPEQVIAAIASIAGKKYSSSKTQLLKEVATRFPSFCSGCYYRLIFQVIKKVAPEGTVFGGDIGCYMIASLPPFELADYLSAMGSSIGIGHGILKAGNKRLISFIGDSTFFHSGIPSLINAVYNKSNPLIVILDNQTTAMTGHQTNPGVGKTGMGEEVQGISIEGIVRACGVKNVKVIDPINAQEMEETVKEFIAKDEVSVIIARRTCWLLSRSKK
ncbi:MAG: thiamine pyrophosphate-dependent enzyme, partial [bacterium]